MSNLSLFDTSLLNFISKFNKPSIIKATTGTKIDSYNCDKIESTIVKPLQKTINNLKLPLFAEGGSLSGGELEGSLISASKDLSKKEIRKRTKYKNILPELIEGTLYNDTQKKRLSEYYTRVSGGKAIPSLSTFIDARRGLRGKINGSTMYENLLYSNAPVKQLIDTYNLERSNIDKYGNTIADEVLNNYDGTLKGVHDYRNPDIIDAIFTSKTPYNGVEIEIPSIYKNYIHNNYNNKNVKAYVYGNSYLDDVTLKKLNSLKDTIILGAETDGGPSFKLYNGEENIDYDGAGYLIQFAKDGNNVYHRKLDIYDFEPQSYINRWGKIPYVSKGLKALNNNSSPVILSTQWEPISSDIYDYYNLDDDVWNSLLKEKDEQNKKKKNYNNIKNRIAGEFQRGLVR